MKQDFMSMIGSSQATTTRQRNCSVYSETDPLTDVLLCRPAFLRPIPCCSVTREALRDGFSTSGSIAAGQHRALQAALDRHGIRCHLITPDETMPDMCFMRDALVTTPWGVLGLRPAMQHRIGEVEEALSALAGIGVSPVARVTAGTAEGGDIAIIRNGLVVIGCSGERTDQRGADQVARLFAEHGWSVIIYPFDPHFLHLDTQFAMVDDDLALACTDVLSDDFLGQLQAHGITTIPVTYKEARTLGCNVLSLGYRRLLTASSNERVNIELRARGYKVEALQIEQFTRCGGGVHCLTMPLHRVRTTRH
ncbi:N-dimethylarginine dimethylaminohydrolase [Sphingomonas zeicaulis]|uniref:dimethylarginine dimethylaminohydrolase family protein n=1 Tax=Sphingomonas zeicaulis TaxID=1632740 RepID=UPI003D242246